MSNIPKGWLATTLVVKNCWGSPTDTVVLLIVADTASTVFLRRNDVGLPPGSLAEAAYTGGVNGTVNWLSSFF